MTVTEQLDAVDVGVTRRPRESGFEVVADFGPARDASVDIVGDTVIVVADDEQYDLAVEGDAQAFMRNGVLTIEVDE